MNHDTTGATDGAGDATLLLDLDGLVVSSVERDEGGGRLVRLVTADPDAAACPSCGVFSVRVKEYVCTRPRDLPVGGSRLDLRWRKRRWYCREPLCPRGSFTETVAGLPPRARITDRLREHAGRLVVDGVCASVVGAGRASGLSWPVVMDAVRDQAAVVLDDDPGPVDSLGIDEVRRGRPRWQTTDVPTDVPADVPDDAPVAVAGDGRVEVGIVELLEDPVPAPGSGGEPARAHVTADRWHVGFTDLTGGQGMLGQVEGRTGDDVAYWLAQARPAWRDRIRYVAIDMCTVFVSAIRRYLPHAIVVVDHFHVVKLATDAVTEVRRRATMTTRGRRGRGCDPEWRVRNLLRRNREDLTGKAFAKLWNTLVELGEPGVTILKAWIAKDLLRRLLALARTHPDRSVISHRLYRFYTWCADAAVPELERLATTISTWWPAIEAFIATGITNAASEGFNRVVKLDARNAYAHAARPPAEPAAASTPDNFDDPA